MRRSFAVGTCSGEEVGPCLEKSAARRTSEGSVETSERELYDDMANKDKGEEVVVANDEGEVKTRMESNAGTNFRTREHSHVTQRCHHGKPQQLIN